MAALSKRIFISLGLLLLGLSACQAPPTAVPVSDPSVIGRITNNSGDPISNANVTAQLAGQTCRTGSNGNYHFDNLPVGLEFITVEAASYQSEFRAVNIRKGSAVVKDISIDLLNDVVPVGFSATVEGSVLIGGAPAVGAKVWVWRGDDSGVTDQAGRYKFDVGAGKLLILAELNGSRGGVVVELPPWATITAPDIILSPR